MERVKIYAHGSYIGNTGYNNHTRDFLRALSDLAEIKVRNYTIGSSWKGYSITPHDNETYLNQTDKKILYQQILWDGDRKRSDYPIYPDPSKEFFPDLNLVLCETNHHIFYDSYRGPKIAYNVWESTLQPEEFFNKLLEYDQFWTPSKWQKECMVKQGYPEEKIRVVPEGVDPEVFFPEEVSHPLTSDGRFKFFLVGRWDYRKSTKEIIETFLKTFSPEEPVDLIVSIDNPFSSDGLETTEERLEYYGISDERIKILHFPSRKIYLEILKSCHVLVSCARSEGWNLPLIEAMACGIPSIYSECSGQMEFAEGKGVPVKILGERPSRDNSYNHFNQTVGNYYEPDFEDLGSKMRYSYLEHGSIKEKSLLESIEIRENFSWKKVAEIANEIIGDFLKSAKVKSEKPISPKKNEIKITYLDGPKVQISGDEEISYLVEFVNRDTDKVLYSSVIKNNMWAACSKKYYIPWRIKINGSVVEDLSLEGKEVLISMESKALGDTIGWVPYAVEFAEKHKCKVILSTFHNHLFKGLKEYKNIDFINPGDFCTCFAIYRLGWFKKDGNWGDTDRNPTRINLIPMQKSASDILGLEYKELNYGLNFPVKKRPIKDEYVVFGPSSTSGCKEWTYENWSSLSNLVRGLGYKVVILSNNQYEIEDTIGVFGKTLDEALNYLYHAKAFVGLGSGLSWANWAIGKHTFMINGFSREDHEFKSNVTRIYNDNICIFCWNDEVFTFDAGDWDWCPVYKGTSKQHICQKSITPFQVFQRIIEKI